MPLLATDRCGDCFMCFIYVYTTLFMLLLSISICIFYKFLFPIEHSDRLALIWPTAGSNSQPHCPVINSAT